MPICCEKIMGYPQTVENLRQYWEAHRTEQDGYIYYAYYLRLQRTALPLPRECDGQPV